MDETWRLRETVNAWWDEIETFIDTRLSNDLASHCTSC
jgi:hypothetical protein